jgi:hypothetical protein
MMVQEGCAGAGRIRQLFENASIFGPCGSPRDRRNLLGRSISGKGINAELNGESSIEIHRPKPKRLSANA